MPKNILVALLECLLAALISCENSAVQPELNTGVSAKPKLAEINNETDLIAYLFAQKGLSRDTACLDRQALAQLSFYDMFLQNHFLKYWASPYGFPEYVYSILDAQEKFSWRETGGIYEQLAAVAARAGYPCNFTMPQLPVPSEENPGKEIGVLFTKEMKTGMDKAMQGVPAELQHRLAEFVYLTGLAKSARDEALKGIPTEKYGHFFGYASKAWTFVRFLPEEFKDAAQINSELGRNLDFSKLYYGALLSIHAAVTLQDFILSNKAELAYSFEFDTPLGKLAFNGKPEDNTYQGEDYFLIADLAGNDTYKGAAAGACGLGHPVSIVLDFAGNDSYAADENALCAQGAGIMGYGILIDYAGDDSYKAQDNAQGICYAGAGLLYDMGGNDTFEARFAAQGSATFGIATLFNKGGNDNYYCLYVGQGFGSVCGYGCLLDTDGNDSYVAEPYNPLFNSVKENGHDAMRNYSFCQGAGWGKRGDSEGAISMAGGTGILQDLAGDDWYECGVYGQASGYWYGTGILHDKSGNDRYEGSFFTQSGTAHMGLTMLLDEAGNDSHHIWHAISLAGAHDLSVSFFFDREGDDKYSCWEWKDAKGVQTLENTGIKNSGGGTLFGAGITNAIAVFADTGGDDVYEVYSKESFGYSLHREDDTTSWRWNLFNSGIFIDVGGNDVYTRTNCPDGWPEPANNSIWEEIDSGNAQKSFGMGIDTEKGVVPEMKAGRSSE
ncbi:MAG: hypothetical protein HZA48_06425 [Planctomycetes bacterium]|nr:hypothetical protein [Planctomycetota bacterium]